VYGADIAGARTSLQPAHHTVVRVRLPLTPSFHWAHSGQAEALEAGEGTRVPETSTADAIL